MVSVPTLPIIRPVRPKRSAWVARCEIGRLGRKALRGARGPFWGRIRLSIEDHVWGWEIFATLPWVMAAGVWR